MQLLSVFHILTADAVFPHSAAKSAGVETKDYRCPGFPLDSPTGFLEHLEDIIVFPLAKGFAVVPRLLFPGLPGILEPVQHLQRGPLARDHRPLDDTLQLAHVTGPVVVLEGVQGVFRHGLDLLSCFLIEFGDKIIDKKRDVFLALPERRDRDGENIEPVEQVFPESALPDLFLQIPVGGRNDPHIDLDGFGAAQPLKLAVLDDPEQLGLKIHRHLADLVEKQGAVVGKFEAPHLPGIGAGERPLFPAEELTFDEVSRQRRAVDRYHRPVLVRLLLL